MSALALSVVLSFVSAVAYAGGAIIQEQVAVSSPGQTYAPLRKPGWWAAVALTALGGLLHVVALAFGPLSLVQPLGALTIVFALPMAALFVGRKAGAAAWRGAIMATVGLAGLLALVGASDAQSLSNAQRVALAVVAGGAVAALMVAGRAAHRHPAVRAVLLAVASGIAFSMSSVFTKTVAVDWSRHVSLADLSSLAAIGAFATAGMLLSQASYRGAGLEAPLATLTVVNPVVAAAVGITMFGETFRYGTTGTALALSCGVVAAGGLILLTTERIGSSDRAASALPERPDLPPADAQRPTDEPAAVAAEVTADELVAVADTADGPVAAADTADGPVPVVVTAEAAYGEAQLAGPVAPQPVVQVVQVVSDRRLPESPVPAVPVVPAAPVSAASAVPAVADLGAVTVGEAAVEELLAGVPKPSRGGDGFTPGSHPSGAGGVPVPAPLKAAVPAMEIVAAQAPAARDELPFLTAMLGVPYVPMPFVKHRRTRVKS
ncbi:DMT family transporter [Streptomyces sp. NBC_00358]|uniref:DMT family transporter n=1 Tax=Streptomyces sp. NBC_00358 TaxID=2975725 RepID=UPI002E27605C